MRMILAGKKGLSFIVASWQSLQVHKESSMCPLKLFNFFWKRNHLHLKLQDHCAQRQNENARMVEAFLNNPRPRMLLVIGSAKGGTYTPS